jgi:SRSO17 transposase
VTWVLIDGELFLPEAWFTPAYAARRAAVDLPAERGFLTKPQLGLAMLQRAQVSGLSIALLACDDLYGKSRDFRAAVDAAHVTYAAEVPSSTQVYLQCPKIGVSRRHSHGKPPTKLKVLSRQVAHEARALARTGQVTWQRVVVHPSERGDLIADFAVRSIWTLTNDMQARREWLVMRRDSQGQITFTLLNAPETTPESVLIQHACQRYFTERLYEDAKSELGWADLQARKYLAWEHHTALTAAATWFVAEEKLKWRAAYARDPDLAQQLAVDVLPALSTANVRELLQAVLPVPQFTPQQARELVTTHLVNRARSTASRLKTQRFPED